MKWPESLTLVRHGESVYNDLTKKKADNPQYQAFTAAFENRKTHPEKARQLALELIHEGSFALGVGDHNTPLTQTGAQQAEIMAKELSKKITVPDVIFVSPYDRTVQTLENMIQGWPALASVLIVPDDRIREQEHGMALLYSDRRVMQALHPEQEALRELQGPYWYRHLQGENVPDVRDRLRSWVNTLIREYAETKVLAVTHHLAILALRANLERLSPEQFIKLDENEKPINAGVTIYAGNPSQGKSGKLILDTYNAQLY